MERGQHFFGQAPVGPPLLIGRGGVAAFDEQHPVESELRQFQQAGHTLRRRADDTEPVDEGVVEVLQVAGRPRDRAPRA